MPGCGACKLAVHARPGAAGCVHAPGDTLASTCPQIPQTCCRFLRRRSPKLPRSKGGKANTKATAGGTKASPLQLGDIFLAIEFRASVGSADSPPIRRSTSSGLMGPACPSAPAFAVPYQGLAQIAWWGTSKVRHCWIYGRPCNLNSTSPCSHPDQGKREGAKNRL